MVYGATLGARPAMYGAGYGASYGAGVHISAASAGISDPTEISGLTSWLKADGTLWQNSGKTTAATSTNDPVYHWIASSGTDAATTSDTFRPFLQLAAQNSLPAIRWPNGGFQRLRVAVSAGATWTVALSFGCHTNIDNVAEDLWSFDSSASASAEADTDVDAQNFYWRTNSSAANQDLGIPATTAAGWQIVIFVFTSGNCKVYAAGDATTPTADFTPNTAYEAEPNIELGRGVNNSTGVDIGEVCIYGAELATADLESLFSYLNNRWAAY